MSVPQKQVFDALQAQVEKVAERFPGYRQYLLEAVAAQIHLEARHAASTMNINQETKKVIDALGDRVQKARRTAELERE